MLDAPPAQPWLPQVRMVWFFIVVTAVALVIAAVRSVDQGAALTAAFLATGLFVALLALMFSACFLLAYFLGVTERAVVGQSETPASPFSDGNLPPQIVPPYRIDADA